MCSVCALWNVYALIYYDYYIVIVMFLKILTMSSFFSLFLLFFYSAAFYKRNNIIQSQNIETLEWKKNIFQQTEEAKQRKQHFLVKCMAEAIFFSSCFFLSSFLGSSFFSVKSSVLIISFVCIHVSFRLCTFFRLLSNAMIVNSVCLIQKCYLAYMCCVHFTCDRQVQNDVLCMSLYVYNFFRLVVFFSDVNYVCNQISSEWHQKEKYY